MMEGYFSEPVLYDPADQMNIQLRCADLRPACIVPVGFVIAPIGMVVA